MTEYFEEYNEDKQFWCKDSYIAGHFLKFIWLQTL